MTDGGNRGKQSYNRLAEVILGYSDRQRVSLRMTGSTEASGNSEDTQGAAWSNPMGAAGSLIEGGESGSAIELAIGTLGYVLTVADIGGGELHPRWQPPSGGAGGQYRQYVVESDGADGFEFIDDGSGSPVYELEDLE